MSANPAADEAVQAELDRTSGEAAKHTQGGIAGKSPMRIALGRLRRDWVAMVSLGFVVFFILVAVFAPLITKAFGVSTGTVLVSQYLDPLTGLPLHGPPLHGFDMDHPFGQSPGTAHDNLAWWVYGCRTSLEIATMATIVSIVVGVVLGLLAGFLGGIIDKVISFVTDFFMTIPFLLAALVLSPIINDRFNTSDHYEQIQFWVLVGVLSVFGWMGIARLIRGEVLSLREREFVQAARVLGMPTRRILFRELLPNLTAPIIVSVSLSLPTFVAAEAGFAYLGIGITGGVSWGQVINDATSFFQTYPLYLWEPLLGVLVLVLSLNLLGDAVRDAFDPKSRR